MIVCALLILSPVAISASFEERAAVAKEIADSTKGSNYESSLGQFIYNAITACIPPGSTDVGNLGKFSLVADVSKDGKVQNPEVQPVTHVSSCFKSEFETQSLPDPPEGLLVKGVLPILIEMDVVQ